MSLANHWRYLDLLYLFHIVHHGYKLLSLECLSITVSSSVQNNLNMIPKLATNAIVNKELRNSPEEFAVYGTFFLMT